jgi:hypothetical protein
LFSDHLSFPRFISANLLLGQEKNACAKELKPDPLIAGFDGFIKAMNYYFV